MLSMSKLKGPFLSINVSPASFDEDEDLLSDPEDTESDRWEEIALIQKHLFEAICNESRTQLKNVLRSHNPSLILQVLVTFTYPNHDELFKHDHDILMDAAELLGPSVINLNAIQSACMLGEEDLAIDVIDYIAKQSERMCAKKVLYEFMSKVWGSGNTILHLASFMGMSSLVKRLIELGANPNKRNERKYKAVDCADDDKTRVLFLNIKEVVSYPLMRSLSVDGGSLVRRDTQKFEPIFTKLAQPVPTLQRSKAINKKILDGSSKRFVSQSVSYPSYLAKEESLSIKEDSKNASLNIGLARAKSLGSSTPTGSDINSSDEDIEVTKRSSRITKPCLKDTTRVTKRVVFDPRTLALDCAKNGDYIQLKMTLENLVNRDYLLTEGIATVFDTVSPFSRLSLLHLAASYNHLSLCQYLVEHGAYINPQDREGWTPLHCAAAEGHESIVKYLVSLPTISIHLLNVDDETPFDVSSQDYIQSLLKEKLVKRMSLNLAEAASRNLEEALPGHPKTKLNTLGSKSGGDSGLLRPTRSSSHHRVNLLTKPFSPPHSFSKPLSDTQTPNTAVATPKGSILFQSSAKNYRYASLTSF